MVPQDVSEQPERQPTDRIAARLISISDLTRDTRLYEFGRADGGDLPSALAGSHIDVCLPNGLVRQYSLVIDDKPSSTYAVAVKFESLGRGGSRYMRDELKIGTELAIGLPRNHFRLAESADHTVLIAGGIGITPILSMFHRLKTLRKSFELHYASRTRQDMAFFDVLNGADCVDLHLDDERGAFLDIDRIRMAAPLTAHYYCCGPLPMLKAFEKAVRDLPADHVHLEYFSPVDAPATGRGFTIELARSKRELFVAPGCRIADVLLKAGINVMLSCEQGICGSCETRVLDGMPDHRDQVLSEAERRAGKSMMICCSRSLTDRLTLDI